MTRVRIGMLQAWPEGEPFRPVRRGMVWTPTAPFLTPDSSIVLPEGFPVVLNYGDVTINVPPSDAPNWVWRVSWSMGHQAVERWVHVPNSTDLLEFANLPVVDPTTLVPGPTPMPAYRAAPLVLDPGEPIPEDTPDNTVIYRRYV